MSLRNMGHKKGGIIKNPKSSKNKYRAFTVESSSVTNEDSLGSSSSLSAPLMHSAEANALRGHGTISQCVLTADKPKLSGKKADFIPWQIRVEAYLDNIDLGTVLTSPTPDPCQE